MKKQDIRTFSLEDLEKKNKTRKAINPMSYEEGRVREHSIDVVMHNIDGISDALRDELKGNPFLFNHERSKHQLYSIEDFFIPNRNEDIQFGEVYRSPKFSISKRKRILKKAFSYWKNDFSLNYKQELSLASDQIFVVGDVTTTKIKRTSYLMFGFIFFLISFFIYRPGEVWQKTWIEKVNIGLNNAFAISWINILSQIVLYTVIIAIFASFMYNEIIKNYDTLSKDAPKLYNKAKISIDNDFKKKFKQTKNHYLNRSIKKNATIPTFPIENTSVGDIDFDDIQKMTNSYIEKSANLKRKKTLMKLSSILTIYTPIALGVIVGGYIIYSIIILLIK